MEAQSIPAAASHFPTGTSAPISREIPETGWYSYLNQCSVYNTAVEAEGQNKEAGHSGSNFGVVYGYVDAYNQAWMAKPEFYFNVPRKLVGLWICNTSYTYGVITYGNQFRVLRG